jgi:starvation-inducible DNA-binding protein
MIKNRIVPFSLFEGFDDGDIGIDKNEQNSTIEFLNKLQSNHFILFMKMWNFHWIVVSKRFSNIHNFFNELYDKFFKNIDDIAERIRSLGGRPIGTLEGYLKETDLKEYTDSSLPQADKMIKEVLSDYETIIKQIRTFLEKGELDNGTNKFLEDLIEAYEKDAWMLRSQLE